MGSQAPLSTCRTAGLRNFHRHPWLWNTLMPNCSMYNLIVKEQGICVWNAVERAPDKHRRQYTSGGE